MPNVTVSLTAGQALAIQSAIPKQNNPAVTNVDTYVQNVVNIDVAQRMTELRGEELTPIREKWDTLTPAQKAAVRTAAGL